MSEGIPWTTIRAAVRGWVVGGASPEIAADHVIWAGQQKAIPDGMYVTLDVNEEQDHGFDLETYVVNVDGSVTQHATGPRTLTISIVVYGGVLQADATLPYRIASRIRARLSLSAVNDALNAANVGVMDWSNITTPGRGINSTAFEPRAMFDVWVSVVSDVSSPVDTIATVEIADTLGHVFQAGATPIIPLFLQFGDSQIVGEATTDSADPGFNVTVTQPTTFVLNHDFHYALAANDPITYQTDVTGGVRPYAIGGTPGLGMQVTIGKALAAAQLRCVMASFGIFGLAVKQSVSTSTYPTQPPAGPNVSSQLIARVHALEATWGAQTKAILVSNGGNDGANNTDASALAANSAQLLAELIAAFPHATIFWLKINADTVNAAGFVGMSTAIAQQASFFAAHPTTVTPIVTDDCALLSDHAHFNADTCEVVGGRFAFRALDAIGVPRARPATFPAVIDFGPEAFTNGTVSANPHSSGGALAGDLEVLVAVTLTASGTNNAISTPSGWTLIGTTTSTNAGAIIRAAFYRRVVDAAMISANNGWTAPTTIAAANLDEFSQIVTIRGPSANPTIEASQLSANNSFSTSLAMTGVTTLGANRTIAMITVGFRTNQTANPITISAPGLSNLTVVKNGTRDSGRSNFCTIDVQTGQLAAAGATGNPSATSALNMIAIGVVLSIAP